MKFTFTQKEYTRLLELAYIGMHVVAGRQGFDSPAARRYADLEQKLFDLATSQGCADLVTIGSDGRLMPSEVLENDERIGKILAGYDNDTFWFELVRRLSDRDLATEQAKHQLAGAGGPPINTEERLKQLEDAYWDEFEKHDLAKVVLLKGGRG
jgi:hypothetical protein